MPSNTDQDVYYVSWCDTGCYVDRETAVRIVDAYTRSERTVWFTDLAGSRTNIPLESYAGVWVVSQELAAAQRVIRATVGIRDEEEP